MPATARFLDPACEALTGRALGRPPASFKAAVSGKASAYRAETSAETVGDGSIRIRNAQPVTGIVDPGRACPVAVMVDSASIGTAAMKSEKIKEESIEEQRMCQPVQSPTPTAPAEQPREPSQIRGDIHRLTESEASGIAVRIPELRIITFRRRSPNVLRTVGWNIHNLRIGGLDLNRVLAVLILGGHGLLGSIDQPSLILGAGAHLLNGVHDVSLLGQKCVPQRGGPLDIAGEQRHGIRKGHQRLYTGIPILLLGRVQQLCALQVPISLQELLRFHDFKRISGRSQDLTEQLVRIQGHRGDQVVELIGCQQLRWFRRNRTRNLSHGGDQARRQQNAANSNSHGRLP